MSIKQMPIAYILWDSEYRVLEWNQAAVQIFGYSEEEMLGQPLFEAIVPKEVLHLVEGVGAKLFSGKSSSYSAKNNNVKKDGKLISCLWHNAPIYEKNGEIKTILSMAQDVTEQMLADEEIRRSKILLQSSIESPRDMIILSLDREYRYLYFNKTHADSMAHVFSSKPQIGDCIFDHMKGKDDIAKVKAHYDRAMNGEGHVAIEKYGEGQVRYYYEIRYNPIYDEKNEIIGVTVFAQNIMERKQVENKIKQLNESYDRLTDNADEAIFKVELIDGGGKVVYLNPAAERIFGYTLADWDSDPDFGFKIIHPDYAEKHAQILEEIITYKKAIKNVVLGWIAKDGRKIILEYTIIPIIDKEGNITHFESIGRDITERRLAEQSFNEVNTRLITEQVTLRAKNLALKEILGQIDNEKEQTKLRINSNIQKIILPILDSLQNRLNKADLEYIKLLRDSLMDIVSPFVAELEKGFTSLSPRELEICNMIKRGMTCKEIASTLNIAVQTVLKQRKHIRKKLGISRRKINLTTHLRTIKS